MPKTNKELLALLEDSTSNITTEEVIKMISGTSATYVGWTEIRNALIVLLRQRTGMCEDE